MNTPSSDLGADLRTIVSGSPWFMRALRAARELELPSWCIGAGAVRNLVWDHLHGYTTPSPLADIDLAYFDPTETAGAERSHQARITSSHPEFPWEITNQAHVHLWFESHFGHAVPPLASLQEAVASWPEFATSVGVTLSEADAVDILAPLGLDDLFAMRVRRNPARVSVETYRQRTASKRYVERWPRVSILGCEHAA